VQQQQLSSSHAQGRIGSHTLMLRVESGLWAVGSVEGLDIGGFVLGRKGRKQRQGTRSRAKRTYTRVG
jgi:hypothetical protein